MARTVLELLAPYGIDEVYGIDFETFYSTEYSLRRMPTTNYVTDPQFKTHMASVQSSKDRVPKVLNPKQFVDFAKSINWRKTALLAHHTHFDGLILSHHYGVTPAFYLDTLSMARPVMPVRVRLGLDPLCRAFGLVGKVDAQSLENVKGVRDLSPAQFKRLAKYAGNDIAKTWMLFRKLFPYTTEEELWIIDATIRMYTEPSVQLDFELIERVRQQSIEAKALMLKSLKTTAKELGSAEQFATLLRKAGVEPPMKANKRGDIKYAFAKSDVPFKALLKHPKKRVRDLVEARLGVKSAIIEKRTDRMLSRRHLLAQPIYLQYWGARATGRWSGGDKVNWQNWPKRDAFKRKVKLREALKAPPGHKFIIADQRQIEARFANWQAGNRRIVEAFAAGEDVYRIAASGIYGIPVEEINDPSEERFVGKTTTLGCIYGIGALRFANTLRAGVMGPEKDITDAEAQRIIKMWRQSNYPIVQYWKTVEAAARSAWLSGTRVECGVVVFEGAGKNGFIHLPNGTSLRYDDVQYDGEQLSYLREVKSSGVEIRTRLWGGHIFENITQALARALLARQLVLLRRAMPNVKIASSTHDEILVVAPARSADKALRETMKAMRNVPAWAKGMPLDVSAKISDIYDKE